MPVRMTSWACVLALGLLMPAGCRSGQKGAKGPAGPAPKGVLEFRILADKAREQDAEQVDACRAAFAKDGPVECGPEVEFRWYKIKDPVDFFKNKDIATQFEDARKQSGMVLERRGDEYYVLAHTAPDYVMTRAGGSADWAVEKARVNRSTHGYVGIDVDLDAPGGARMEKLTQAHKGREMGIFIDDQVFLHATIQDVTHQNIRISGAFSLSEAENLVKLLQQASGHAKPEK
jgi:hypothetical protein